MLGTSSVVAFCLTASDPTITKGLLAVGALLFADVVEYVMHRFPMHRRRRATRVFFRRHTIAHHRFFTNEVMGMDRFQDVVMVMASLPTIALTAVILAVFGAVVSWTWDVETGIFAASVLGLWATGKELLHLSFHLPENCMTWPVFRGRIFQAMRRHHTIHHDLRLMRRWNFCIGVPLVDAVCGTLTFDEDSTGR